MDAAPLLFDVCDGIAVITLNRPESMNAYTGEMGELWTEAYQRSDADDAIRAVVVTGNGKAFCAGADLSEGNAFDTPDVDGFSSCPVFPAWRVRKPIIAACNGHAIGLGFSLALQCDFRILANDAQYGLLQVRRGVLADGCSHWILPRLVGMEKALGILLSGRRMNGQQAHAMGLASQSLPADEVLPEAMAMAGELAMHSAPLVMGMAKRLVWSSSQYALDEMAELETRCLLHTMGKADALEGGAAWAEKRSPLWNGQGMICHDA